MLKPDEEFDLARRVQKTGDSDAAFRLVSSHLRLVVKIAMDFQRRWMQNVLDLIQEGNVGLMRAVNKFDPDKGIKFSYYAAFWIRAYILKFIMDNWRMVKIGTTQAQRKLFYNLNRERQKLIAEGFDPDAATLAECLGVGEDQIVEMQQRLDASDMSLDATVGDESGSATRMDFLPALGPGIEESLAGMEIAELLQSKIRDILPSLSEKEAYILEHRLLTDDPVTLREIGERYNVTRPFRSRVADRNDLIDRNAWEHAQNDGLFPIQIIAERTRKVDPVDLGCFDFHFLKQNRNARRNGGLGKLEFPDILLRNDNVPFVALLASKGQHKFPHTADRA